MARPWQAVQAIQAIQVKSGLRLDLPEGRLDLTYGWTWLERLTWLGFRGALPLGPSAGHGVGGGDDGHGLCPRSINCP